jgi:antitoxin YefM
VDSITYTTARANLAKTMDRVCQDHEPVIITRSGETSVVMLSLDDFHSLEETAYLFRSPKNAQRLLEAILELEREGERNENSPTPHQRRAPNRL